MKSISLSDVEHAVRTIADTVIANENYFSKLDGTCGDGDFGTSLATGFRTVLGKWDIRWIGRRLGNSSPRLALL